MKKSFTKLRNISCKKEYCTERVSLSLYNGVSLMTRPSEFWKKFMKRPVTTTLTAHPGEEDLSLRIFLLNFQSSAVDYTRRCDKCQAKIPKAPPTVITPMVSPWPFAVCDIDIIGVLPISKDGAKYAIMTVDYFTKWAEQSHWPRYHEESN